MTIEDVIKRQRELTLQHEAQLALFRTCCVDDNKDMADLIRIHLNTLMNEMYDCIYLSTRLMIEAKKNG